MKPTKNEDSSPYKFSIGDLLVVIGMVMVSTGLWFITPLAVLIFSGVVVMTAGLIRSRG